MTVARTTTDKKKRGKDTKNTMIVDFSEITTKFLFVYVCAFVCVCMSFCPHLSVAGGHAYTGNNALWQKVSNFSFWFKVENWLLYSWALRTFDLFCDFFSVRVSLFFCFCHLHFQLLCFVSLWLMAQPHGSAKRKMTHVALWSRGK